jgi:hypothetical protein
MGMKPWSMKELLVSFIGFCTLEVITVATFRGMEQNPKAYPNLTFT